MTGPGGGGTSPSADERAAVASERQQGVLAGAMFIAGVLVSLPGSFLIQPAPPVGFYALLASALVTGIVCLALPWERMSRLWFHGLGGLATVEVTVAASFDDSYVFLYLFIAIFWAYVARSRIELGAQLGLVSLGLLSPLVYEPDATRDTVQAALLWIPSLALMSLLVMYMRERLEADRRAYRRFAEETVALAARIRGREAEPIDPALLSARSTLLVPPLPRLRLGWRRTAAAAAGMIVALCLVPVGLAAAGVELPKQVRMPFEEVGIELPNQPADEPPPADAPEAEPNGSPRDEAKAASPDHARKRRKSGRERPSKDAGGEEVLASGEAAAILPAPRQGPEAPRSGGASPPTRSEPDGGRLGDAVDEALRDTLGPVDRLLEGVLGEGGRR